MLLFFRIILIIITVAIALYVLIRNSEIRLKINNLIYSSSSKKTDYNMMELLVCIF